MAFLRGRPRTSGAMRNAEQAGATACRVRHSLESAAAYGPPLAAVRTAGMIAMSATINSDAPLAERDGSCATAALVRGWLYVVLLVLFALVMVGGATRMTGSGLSITEWKPIHGVIPPLNQAEWQEEFEKYQQIPQYEQINKGMTLEEFKGIFWWEWAHRLLGARRRLPRRHSARASSGRRAGSSAG